MLVSAAVLQTEQQKLSEKLIRLHVVANSDSAHDQQIKLRVRDAILEKTQPLLRGADDPRGALEAHWPTLNMRSVVGSFAISRNSSS